MVQPWIKWAKEFKYKKVYNARIQGKQNGGKKTGFAKVSESKAKAL